MLTTPCPTPNKKHFLGDILHGQLVNYCWKATLIADTPNQP